MSSSPSRTCTFMKTDLLQFQRFEFPNMSGTGILIKKANQDEVSMRQTLDTLLKFWEQGSGRCVLIKVITCLVCQVGIIVYMV